MTKKPLFNFKHRHKTIIGLIRKNQVRLISAVLCMIAGAGTTAALAYLVKPVIDRIFVEKDARMLAFIPVVVIIVALIKSFTTYGQTYYMDYVGQGIIRELRNMLYNRIQDMPISFFHREKTGALISRVVNDVMIIKNMVSSSVTSSLKDVFTVIGLTGVIFYQDWKMALVAFFVIPLAFYPIIKIGRRVRKVSTRRQESMGNMSSFLHETFAGNKIVKAFGMEDFEKGRFFNKTLELFKIEMKEVRAHALSSPIMEFLGYIAISIIIYYGGSRVINGDSTPGTFFSFIAGVTMLYSPLKHFSKINNAIQQGLAAVDRVFDIIEKDTDIREAENPVSLITGPHRVEFKEVFFKYEEEFVLKNINLAVNPGEVLALVGMSGGGKTTLVNLIPRFYDVSSGVIEIDGLDIRNVSISSLRRQIAIVTQEPILFNDTVRNNIAYGNAAATDMEIENAAKSAYAYDFIKNFPHGFETNIGELGARLSGGEKQRICVARALLKDAPILILDEATSALDSEAEQLVQKALENLMQGRTTFVIAHRLSTIINADRIVMMVNGRIVETGMHQELMTLKGEYFKLHHLQYNPGGGDV